MPAADELFTNEVQNLYPVPESFGKFRVIDLLRAAALGRIGADQRLIAAILAHGKDAVPGLLQYFAEAADDDLFAIELDDLVVDLLRHLKAPEALDVYVEMLRRAGGRSGEALADAIIEIGAPAVAPLLKLAGDLDESQLSDVVRIVAALRVPDERVYKLLLDHLEYDTFSGALSLALYGDRKGIEPIRKALDGPGVDEELRHDLERCIQELELEQAPAADIPVLDIFKEYPEKEPPVLEVLAEEEREALLASSSAEYRIAVLDDLTPDEVDEVFGDEVRELAESDPDSEVRGRAWECLVHEIGKDNKLAAGALAVAKDTSRDWSERGGALLGYASAKDATAETRALIEQQYKMPERRAQALKTMWRSFDSRWIDYFPKHLADPDRAVLEQAIFGVGHFAIVSSIDRLEKLFEDEDLRPAAIYAYALAVPGGTDRTKARSLFRRIEKLADGLDEEEQSLVETAIDQRLVEAGKRPVFGHEPE